MSGGSNGGHVISVVVAPTGLLYVLQAFVHFIRVVVIQLAVICFPQQACFPADVCNDVILHCTVALDFGTEEDAIEGNLGGFFPRWNTEPFGTSVIVAKEFMFNIVLIHHVTRMAKIVVSALGTFPQCSGDALGFAVAAGYVQKCDTRGTGVDESQVARAGRAAGPVALQWSGIPFDLDGVAGITDPCLRFKNADYSAHVIDATVFISAPPIGSSHHSLTWTGFYTLSTGRSSHFTPTRVVFPPLGCTQIADHLAQRRPVENGTPHQ